MIDLTSKLSSFRKMVWDNEKKKSEKELYDSSAFSSNTIENKRQKLNRNLQKYLEKRRVFATTRKNEIIAKKSEEEKSSYYKYKESLLEEIIDDIRSELVSYAKSEEYKEKLKKDVKKSYDDLTDDEKKSLELCVRKEDKNLFDFETMALPDSDIGGFILKDKDGSFEYDFSLRKKLLDYKYEIGKKLYTVLDKEEVI